MIQNKQVEREAEILTVDALSFLEKLHERFEKRRQQILQARLERERAIDEGALPDFLQETTHIRESEWQIASVPNDLQDRRVEITGPAGDPKMVINALNSGAHIFMVDFEDANSPTRKNSFLGQVYVKQAIEGTLTYTSPQGKHYVLNETRAVIVVRPRGWHLQEKHLLFQGKPMAASLVDFGLFFFHNAHRLLQNGSGPYVYLPKLESYQEAELWNDVFTYAQEALKIPYGTIKATVLIETITACFEAEEMIYSLKDHCAGLNCGRWDYIFSYIKKLKNHASYVLPDRALVTMTVPFMRAYTQYVISVCHKRGAHAIGGMAAQIPIKNNEQANEQALQKVRSDKEREALDGHDGSWVAHPALVPIVKEVFNNIMPEANQIDKKLDHVKVTAAELLQPPVGHITEHGLRMNISISIQYIAAWLCGRGAVPLYHLMEDAATAEISRAQIWQWIKHPQGMLEDGREVNAALVAMYTEEELEKLKKTMSDNQWQSGRYEDSLALFTTLVHNDTFEPFLTTIGYEKMDKGAANDDDK
ncbi:malate synthase [Fictibacillus macauensis ZFHKF-1]|uniref:Malate synthase n=1 Tax=Fictibacillus macauensis ZFHKF-1 TaxID=1196324 RepID=I8J1U9_9BACL|nr:malate synthase A [Fictibacillus macauensis]EIT85716.1 malate synthase [Fictibacillus macauensis ZFHKF-1]